MARVFANVKCSIWDDPEFCTLSAGAQRTYFMLFTQTEITACGLLALTLRRWAKTCGEKDLEVWLAELSDARYVLIDEDSEELLVRTFAKHDEGYKHSKRRLAVVGTARAIRSETLRTTAWIELGKLGVSNPTVVAIDSQSIATVEAIDSRRFLVNVSREEPVPETGNQEREPAPLRAAPPSMFCSRHPKGTEQACGPCGTAKLRYAAHVKSTVGREVEARKAAEQRRTAAVLAENASARASAVPRPKETTQ